MIRATSSDVSPGDTEGTAAGDTADAAARDTADRPVMIAASDLPNKLSAALVHVRETKQPAFVVQDGAPAGVLLDVEDYNRLVELAERGELQEAIARAAEADATGDIVDWDDVKRDLFGWLSEKQ